jgi:hypothetical protein
MDMRGIERSFLHDLYVKCYTDGCPTLQQVEQWATSASLDMKAFRPQYEDFLRNGLIEFKQDEGLVHMTPKGTLYTEKNGYAPADLMRQNRDMRTKLLHTMAAYLIKCAPNITVADLVERAGLQGKYCLGNLDLLVSMGYARWMVQDVRLHISSKVAAKDESLTPAHK